MQSKRQILVWPWPKARCRHSNDIDFNDLAIDVGDVGIDLISCRDKGVLYQHSMSIVTPKYKTIVNFTLFLAH